MRPSRCISPGSIPPHIVLVHLAEEVVAAIDRLRLEQVFSNILVNAAKYSKEKTTIRIHTTLLEGNWLQISVRDEGIGMTEQNLRRVFEKFFRVEEIARSYSGVGHGLVHCFKDSVGTRRKNLDRECR